MSTEMAQTIPTSEILAAALEGFEAQKKRIDAQIAAIRQTLRGVPPETAKPRRKVSAAARKRMAAAQRKRWAAIKNKSAA
jgi:hypothetical protein